MGDMLVAHEDDVPKNRSLKVSGRCALDSGLGVANTFGTYCIIYMIYPRYYISIISNNVSLSLSLSLYI